MNNIFLKLIQRSLPVWVLVAATFWGSTMGLQAQTPRVIRIDSDGMWNWYGGEWKLDQMTATGMTPDFEYDDTVSPNILFIRVDADQSYNINDLLTTKFGADYIGTKLAYTFYGIELVGWKDETNNPYDPIEYGLNDPIPVPDMGTVMDLLLAPRFEHKYTIWFNSNTQDGGYWQGIADTSPNPYMEFQNGNPEVLRAYVYEDGGPYTARNLLTGLIGDIDSHLTGRPGWVFDGWTTGYLSDIKVGLDDPLDLSNSDGLWLQAAWKNMNATLTFDCNSPDGGDWDLSYQTATFLPGTYHYDGFSDDLFVNILYDQPYQLDDLLKSMIGPGYNGSALIHANGYYLVGWEDIHTGIQYKFDGVVTVPTNDGMMFKAIWSPTPTLYPGTIVFDCNRPDRGFWQMPAMTSTLDKSYDGTSELFYTYVNASQSYQIDELLSKKLVPNYLGSMLINTSGYLLTGWLDEKTGVRYQTNDYVVAVDPELRLKAIWEYVTPTLHWLVLVGNGAYKDGENQGKTMIPPDGTSLYLQAYLDGGSLNFDSWEIIYHTSDPVYHFAMSPTPASKEFQFNNNQPYKLPGKTTYTVDEIIFYQDGRRLSYSITQQDILYQYTLEIGEEVEPKLQWMAGVNTNVYSSFGQNSNVVIEKDGFVYLGIKPVETNILYDSWQFEYSVTPGTFYKTIPVISENTYYFNDRQAYSGFDSLQFSVTGLKLFYRNQEIRDIRFDAPYTFFIGQKAAEPEEDEVEVIEIPTPAEPFCTAKETVSLSYIKIEEGAQDVKYAIYFSESAKAAGFKDKTVLEDLPADLSFKIDIPGGAPSGNYSGTVVVECSGIDKWKEEYPFTFSVVNNGITIINHPPALQSLCSGASLALVVDVAGDANGYQWYKDGRLIGGAENREYVANTAGVYYVEIMGQCGPIRSNVAQITSPSSSGVAVMVKAKWGNVLYVENASDKYTRYQWYRDGKEVQGATDVYFSEKDGLIGDYYVRCYKPDGSFDETCPVLFTTRSVSVTANVYPSVIKSNDMLNIRIVDAAFGAEAEVEIYSILGLKVYSTKINSAVATIRPAGLNKGNYIVRIKLATGEVLNEKIIVR
ncbi:MAG: T9SS type A sorting domain-containing protein [Tannerella sp.]|jgi:hypothetical protein|nr:T9SS type A sorting domain-containing protein [Tannerella sp.]